MLPHGSDFLDILPVTYPELVHAAGIELMREVALDLLSSQPQTRSARNPRPHLMPIDMPGGRILRTARASE